MFIMHTERSVFPQLLYQKEEGCKWPSMKVVLRQTGGSKKHGFEVLEACGGEREAGKGRRGCHLHIYRKYMIVMLDHEGAL